ncbi:hypothetical protein NA57DRAFT_30080, partial [Rhizodiscina lignyota]
SRLVIWYCIITSLFFCPQSLSNLDQDSPAICKPYLQARSYLAPYIDPYYETYVAPYAKQAEPYVNQFNTQIYTPAAAVSKKYYGLYAAPSIDKVYKYADDEWEKSVQPYLLDVQKQAQKLYEQQVAPYAKAATDNISPYYQQTSETLQGAYKEQLIPAYDAAKPYAGQAWDQGHHLVVHVVFPYVRWAEKESRLFLSRQVWPKLRVLYGENVEPQLVRISERLGRYKDGKKLEAAIESIDSLSASGTIPPSAASSMASSISESPYPSQSSTGTQASASSTPATEAEVREKIASDLKTWQEKFAKAADKGAEDLEERVKEIIDRQIDHQANGVGKALVIQLEETVNSKLKSVKNKINAAVKGLPEEAKDKDIKTVHDAIVKDIREAGRAIREKAQAVRSWKQNYDQETYSLVKAASDSTLDVIDNIRDLGLQEIGMRWAWMEGVTYKDWSKYHALKKTFDEWRDEVESVAMEHKGLAEAKKEGDAIEDKGMSIAEEVAKELARLKDVAKWKLQAGDATEDFRSRKLPAAAVKAAQQVIEKVVPGGSSSSSQGSSASESVVNSLSSLLSAQRAKASKKAGQASEEAKFAASSVPGSVENLASPSVESVLEEASSSASSGLSSASSNAKEGVSSASSASSASSSAKKVVGGVSAGFVAATQAPILDDVLQDDDMTVQEKLKGFVDIASNEVARLSEIMAQAVKPTPTQGTVESMTSVASEQWSSAMSAALGALYAPHQESSLGQGIEERYSKAITAASHAIYGTPPPLTASLASEASSRYVMATSMAAEQYEIARSRLSEQIHGESKPVHEEMLSSIESAYSGSLAQASKKLNEALKITDSVMNAVYPTQGPLESISSMASAKLSEGLAEASKQYTSAKVALHLQPPSKQDQYFSAAQAQYYQALGYAHDQYSGFISTASSAAYGTPTPAYESLIANLAAASSSASVAFYGSSTGMVESLASAVSENAESVASIASSGVYGRETPWAESVAHQASANWEDLVSRVSNQVYQTTAWHEAAWSTVGSYGAQVTDAASSHYSSVSALVSELVAGKEPDFTESVMLRLSSAYATGFGIPEMAASASSVASEAYESASSVVASVFTPPATLENVFEAASEQFNSAVAAASIQVYGSEKGTFEKATSAAAEAAESVASQASDAVYGTQPSYVEQAQSQLDNAASSARDAISVAFYGTPTGTFAAATSAADERYSSLLSAASVSLAAAGSQASSVYEDATASVSSMVYGPEKGAFESATSRLAEAVESARAKIVERGSSAQSVVAETVEHVSEKIEEMTSKASKMVKDEL